MDPGFIALLQDIRTELGFPLVINSGFRCPDHNARVSSTGPDGPHTTGRAVDIAATSASAWLILEAALRRKVPRVGLARTFVHLDVSDSPSHPRPRAWTY